MAKKRKSPEKSWKMSGPSMEFGGGISNRGGGYSYKQKHKTTGKVRTGKYIKVPYKTRSGPKKGKTYIKHVRGTGW